MIETNVTNKAREFRKSQNSKALLIKPGEYKLEKSEDLAEPVHNNNEVAGKK
jgi:hypothetical protein